MTILIVNLCDRNNKLHEDEFVRPIKDIVKQSTKEYEVIHYKDLGKIKINSSNKIILCGTSLKELNYLKNDWSWIKEYKKPLLGICAGAQVMAKAYGEELIEALEIGLQKINILEEDKIFKEVDFKEIYSLHNLSFNCPKDFNVLAENENGIQTIKKDNAYAVLFHPETRNKKLIENFSLIDF